MARVTTKLTLENRADVQDVEQRRMVPDAVRRVGILDACADDEAVYLSLPISLIERLGLFRSHAPDPLRGAFFQAVRLTILGRSCTLDAKAVPDDQPVTMGRLALLALDLVIDARTHSIVGNPAHEGEWILEL